DDFFDRTENSAMALPPKPKKWVVEIIDLGLQFPLRLFCCRITEQIVVLFNGGIKDANSVQASKNISMKFYEAQIYVKRIEEALQSGMIVFGVDERCLENFDGSNEIIL